MALSNRGGAAGMRVGGREASEPCDLLGARSSLGAKQAEAKAVKSSARDLMDSAEPVPGAGAKAPRRSVPVSKLTLEASDPGCSGKRSPYMDSMFKASVGARGAAAATGQASPRPMAARGSPNSASSNAAFGSRTATRPISAKMVKPDEPPRLLDPSQRPVSAPLPSQPCAPLTPTLGSHNSTSLPSWMPRQPSRPLSGSKKGSYQSPYMPVPNGPKGGCSEPLAKLTAPQPPPAPLRRSASVGRTPPPPPVRRPGPQPPAQPGAAPAPRTSCSSLTAEPRKRTSINRSLSLPVLIPEPPHAATPPHSDPHPHPHPTPALPHPAIILPGPPTPPALQPQPPALSSAGGTHSPRSSPSSVSPPVTSPAPDPQTPAATASLPSTLTRAGSDSPLSSPSPPSVKAAAGGGTEGVRQVHRLSKARTLISTPGSLGTPAISAPMPAIGAPVQTTGPPVQPTSPPVQPTSPPLPAISPAVQGASTGHGTQDSSARGRSSAPAAAQGGAPLLLPSPLTSSSTEAPGASLGGDQPVSLNATNSCPTSPTDPGAVQQRQADAPAAPQAAPSGGAAGQQRQAEGKGGSGSCSRAVDAEGVAAPGSGQGEGPRASPALTAVTQAEHHDSSNRVAGGLDSSAAAPVGSEASASAGADGAEGPVAPALPSAPHTGPASAATAAARSRLRIQTSTADDDPQPPAAAPGPTPQRDASASPPRPSSVPPQPTFMDDVPSLHILTPLGASRSPSRPSRQQLEPGSPMSPWAGAAGRGSPSPGMRSPNSFNRLSIDVPPSRSSAEGYRFLEFAAPSVVKSQRQRRLQQQLQQVALRPVPQPPPFLPDESTQPMHDLLLEAIDTAAAFGVDHSWMCDMLRTSTTTRASVDMT